jgi:hypothetical protein
MYFGIFINTKFHHYHDLKLNIAYADARGVDGNLHLPEPSMDRLNQTEPATFKFCRFARSLGIPRFPILGLARSYILRIFC